MKKKRTGSWHCKLNLSIRTDGSVMEQSHMTQFKKELRKVIFLRIKISTISSATCSVVTDSHRSVKLFACHYLSVKIKVVYGAKKFS